MQRRSFVKTALFGTGSLAAGFSTGCTDGQKTHLLTLSFDDGFKKSFFRIAEIHERYGLKACLNIIASAHTWATSFPNDYHKFPVGNFDDWNALKSRGHEIMPHSWDHSNLTQMPPEQAKEDILRCLDYFEKYLVGFTLSDAVYNFAYNASTPDLEDFALTRVRAVRSGGWNVLGNDRKANPIPGLQHQFKLGCWSYGPGIADKWIEQEVKEFLSGQGGWLILNLHGLDDEGWGPVSSDHLDGLLSRLVKLEFLEILPAGAILKKYSLK